MATLILRNTHRILIKKIEESSTSKVGKDQRGS